MNPQTALVIGAGIGGIATAARLAQHGYRVTVVEKCEQPGGRCGRMIKNGHHFDTGPTLFLMPDLFAQTFTDLGVYMKERLTLRRIDPTYRIYFDDNTTLSLTSNLNAMQAQLEAIEPGSFGSYLRYLNEGYTNYKLSLAQIVNRNFLSFPEFFNLKNLLLILKLKALKNHYKNLGNYFHDYRLKTAFTFQDMYVGLSPYQAPAIFSLLQYTELTDGVWLPVGGMYRVIELLVDIAQKWGVQFHHNAPVAQINIDGQTATGVTLADGRNLSADVVIANADLPYVYRHLLPDRRAADRMERKKYTCSTLMFFWGVNKQYPQLKTHNLFFGNNYRQSFDRIFRDSSLPESPSFYMHTPVRIDPSLAPKGHDSLTAVVPVGHINRAAPQDWSAIKTKARHIVLERLAEIGVSDLENHIKFEVSFSPPDWRKRYNLVKGATHGLSHTLTQMGYLRPRNRHNRYRNLYFVGASTHPGTGLPTVLVSARLTAERILLEAGIPQKRSVMTSNGVNLEHLVEQRPQ